MKKFLFVTLIAMASSFAHGETFSTSDTALVITDPQIDFLSEKGVTWGMVGQSVEENNTVENIGALFKAAKASGVSNDVVAEIQVEQGNTKCHALLRARCWRVLS